jgi:hypothetical protein
MEKSVELQFFKSSTLKTKDVEMSKYLKKLIREKSIRYDELKRWALRDFNKLFVDFCNKELGFDPNTEHSIRKPNNSWIKTINHRYTSFNSHSQENIELYYNIYYNFHRHAFPLEVCNKPKKKHPNDHYTCNKTVGGDFKLVSDIICLDIDNHPHNFNIKEAERHYKTCVDLFKSSIIFVEKSKANGYHLYIKLDKKYSKKEKKDFFEKIKTKYYLDSRRIELNPHSRYPFSYEYECLDPRTPFDHNVIKPFQFINAFKELTKNKLYFSIESFELCENQKTKKEINESLKKQKLLVELGKQNNKKNKKNKPRIASIIFFCF